MGCVISRDHERPWSCSLAVEEKLFDPHADHRQAHPLCEESIHLMLNPSPPDILASIFLLLSRDNSHYGAWGSVVVKALRHKSVGPGIDSKR